LSEDNNGGYSIYAPWSFNDSLYISYCNNVTGKDKIRLIIHDKEGTVLKKYPNYLEYKNDTGDLNAFNNGIFYNYNDRTYFKEFNYNDTVFCVNETEMSPHIVFKLGDKQPSYYDQNNVDRLMGKYLISLVYESTSFILFNFSHHPEIIKIADFKSLGIGTVHTGYYDKKSKQVFISSSPALERSGGYTISGIPASFYPISINKSNEMIGKMDPMELLANKERISSKYIDIFKNIQEGDNPIVIIAKLSDDTIVPLNSQIVL